MNRTLYWMYQRMLGHYLALWFIRNAERNTQSVVLVDYHIARVKEAIKHYDATTTRA